MPEEIQKTLIEEEMKTSYLDYAMSVIVSRALPDVRDGLKPVHRRILFAMNENGMLHNKPFKKSARIVGDVLGRYHPHGDTAVYDSLVRMAQSFSLRYPLINGQGNWGSQDGDSAAAMRYTEARLSRIAEELLFDIEKDTVNFVPNFDNSMKEPLVLPGKLPNLLLNGSSGIAVGMATNIPPHNLKEVAEAVIEVIDNKDASINELMEKIPGPDFPTGASICGRSGIMSAYSTGRGRIVLRAKTETEGDEQRKIIIKEIPYMVNKSFLIETIADLARDKVIEGISDLRDESDRNGMRIVVELRKGVDENVVLNQLYKNTQLQTTFGVIMLALDEGQPKVMNLKEVIEKYVRHRQEVVRRRTQFDLDKTEKRIHILEGLKVALDNVDPVVQLIKKSKSPEEAKMRLSEVYKLSIEQTQAILDMRLQRLTSLEQDKIRDEHNSLVKLAAELKEILASEDKILRIIKDGVLELKDKYSDERRTEILDVEEDIDIEDMIVEQDVVVTVTHTGYIKQLPLETYKQQKRGGRGIIGTRTKEEDAVEHMFVTRNHNYLLMFTNRGIVHWIKAYKIPQGNRYSRGKAIANLIPLSENERVNAILPISKFDDEHYLLFATRKGLLKKTNLKDYSRPRKGGIRGINLRENDELVQARLTPGYLDMILGTRNGYAVKFNEEDIKAVGRNATGVRGIKLGKDDCVVGMEVALPTGTLLTVTENGFGKRTEIEDYRLIKRGGKGVINIQCNERNGKVVGIKTVKDEDEVMMMSRHGVVIRTLVEGISRIGRNTQGVRLMRLMDDDKVVTIARVLMNN